MAEQTIDDIRTELCAKKDITWELDDAYRKKLDTAISAAIGRLEKLSGTSDLPIWEADVLDLVIEAAWYTMQGMWPQFLADYRESLLTLRLEAGYGIGT